MKVLCAKFQVSGSNSFSVNGTVKSRPKNPRWPPKKQNGRRKKFFFFQITFFFKDDNGEMIKM